MTVDAFIKGYSKAKGSRALSMSLVLAITDLAVILFCFGLGFLAVKLVAYTAINSKSFITYWYYLPAFTFIFWGIKLYPGLSLAHPEELRLFALASLFGHMGIVVSRLIIGNKLDAYSIAFMISWAVSIPIFSAGRGIARRMFMRRAFWGVPVAIFGAGKTGRLLVDRLLQHPWLGVRPVVFLDDGEFVEDSYRGVPIVSGTHNGLRLAEECELDSAIVAMPGVDRARVSDIVSDHVRAFRRYTIIPDFFGMTNMWITVRDFDGIMGLEVNQVLLSRFNQGVKRFLDIAIVVVGGIVVSPFLLLLALAVKIDSPGPIFYGHHRLGKDGKPFKAWKFRSMVRNSKEVLENLLSTDPALREEWENSFKLRDDPRITRMGRFLRKTSLDELPQIWNVLLGEMSLIGPRPIIEAEVEKYGHQYKLFSSVKPGMSGLWQVSGRSDLDYEERVALDIYYIQSWSLWLDLYILFKTFGVVVAGLGAY